MNILLSKAVQRANPLPREVTSPMLSHNPTQKVGEFPSPKSSLQNQLRRKCNPLCITNNGKITPILNSHKKECYSQNFYWKKNSDKYTFSWELGAVKTIRSRD